MGITLNAYFRRSELLDWWALQFFSDFRELSFRNLRMWRWNFLVKWDFTERVKLSGAFEGEIRQEKSIRKESGGLWRSIRNQSPSVGNSPHSPRIGTSLILMLYGSDWNVEKVRRYFLKRQYFYWFENIYFFGKFPDISYQSRPHTRYKIFPFFLKKT